MNVDHNTKPICRLCLSKKRSLVDIFENSQTIYKIMECTNIQIISGDGYPSLICVDCSRRLNNAYKFKKKCETSAETLKKSFPINAGSVTLKSSDEHPFNSVNMNIKSKKKSKSCSIPKSYETVNCQPSIKLEDSNEIDNCVFGDSSCYIEQKIEVLNRTENYNTYVNDNKSTIEDDNVQRIEDAVVNNVLSNDNACKKRKIKRIESCAECGKLYKSPGFLAHHMKIHHGKSGNVACYKTSFGITDIIDRAFVCTICGKRFTQASNLEVHHRSHTGERPFQCDICFKSFTQVNNLYVHKRVHTDVREFKCQECPMEFKLLSHLGEHMKTHSGVKQHQCTSCGKGFHKNSHLLTHMRTHTGEKPFNCEHCGKFFNDSSNLATHIRTHTGNKPFVCKICNKAFVQKISMTRHQKQHTNN